MDTSVADVALILEGTYPYVAGGVSTWVHQILQAYPARQFAMQTDSGINSPGGQYQQR